MLPIALKYREFLLVVWISPEMFQPLIDWLL
ncbi:hypothetical protein SFHH103_00128 [Sinorhizobium fredii HH103]|uniref:Uncharacterized protein n=1 Tax=Sinorhizobium fredii (strain HH103) TaxID=1117943 RepID=G9AA41_SINF1|nr:hypothetical protein SFHH103_00128 [Sinorhizobium fredii HH103]